MKKQVEGFPHSPVAMGGFGWLSLSETKLQAPPPS